MFRFFSLLLSLTAPLLTAAQPAFVANYDENKVGTYTLPDPLMPPNGSRITSAKAWEASRGYWLNQFATHVYGQTPTQPVRLRFQPGEVVPNALGGKATRKQVAIYFADYPALPPINVLLYVPNNARKPAPAFLNLNFCGNHCISTEADLPLSDRWVASAPDNHRATEKSRGTQARRWPLDTIVARGYAIVTAYYGDIEPDHPTGWKTGIRSVLGDTTRTDNWGAIGAWAWGMSRILDYLQTDPTIDAKRVIAMGHSRIGKAALWAAAQDKRFVAAISNEAGEGGASLARRSYGETVGRLNYAFPHWFARQYRSYNDNVPALPVDQHILLSLIAPRPLYVASAEDDRWSDPRGEFLSAKATEPVYGLYRKTGIGTAEYPAVNTTVGQLVRYHVRTGPHDVQPFDWWQYLNFADALVK